MHIDTSETVQQGVQNALSASRAKKIHVNGCTMNLEISEWQGNYVFSAILNSFFPYLESYSVHAVSGRGSIFCCGCEIFKINTFQSK